MRSLSKKIILTGGFCVGKTSLISRFVYQRFLYIYQTTLGVRIDRKTVVLNNASINMLIWDIGGEQTQSRVPESYYLGSSGVIYVFDVARKSSYENIGSDLQYIQQKMPTVPIIVVGNKVDLLNEEQLLEVQQSLPITADFYTSAKEDIYVEQTFLKLANILLNED